MSKSSTSTTSSKQNKKRNIQQQTKSIPKTTINLQKSYHNYYPLVPNITSYFHPKPKLVKKPTPSSLLIKQIKKSSNSIRLKLKKQEKKEQSPYLNQSPLFISPIILRTPKRQSSNNIDIGNDKSSTSNDNTSTSFSYCMSSTSELSDSFNISLPNLDKELRALTTTTLQSPSKPYQYQTQHETKYPSITIPSGIAKLILIDSKKSRPNKSPLPAYYPPSDTLSFSNQSSLSTSSKPSFNLSKEINTQHNGKQKEIFIKNYRSNTSQTILPKSNITKQLISNTIAKDILTSPIHHTPRIYNPLKHQQGIWSYSRLYQHCPSYPGISPKDSMSTISQDDQHSISSSSTSNSSNNVSNSNIMLCLTTNANDNIENKSTIKQYRKVISKKYNHLIQHQIKSFINYSGKHCKTVTTEQQSLNLPTNKFNGSRSEIIQEYDSVYGDPLIDKEDSSTRILYQNSGSIGLSNTAHTLEVICEFTHKTKADILCLAETNTHWKHTATKNKLLQVTKQFWKRSKIQTSETITQWTSINKPGGTMMLSSPKLTSRVISSGEDEEGYGRWSYTTYGGKNNT